MSEVSSVFLHSLTCCVCFSVQTLVFVFRLVIWNTSDFCTLLRNLSFSDILFWLRCCNVLFWRRRRYTCRLFWSIHTFSIFVILSFTVAFSNPLSLIRSQTQYEVLELLYSFNPSYLHFKAFRSVFVIRQEFTIKSWALSSRISDNDLDRGVQKRSSTKTCFIYSDIINTRQTFTMFEGAVGRVFRARHKRWFTALSNRKNLIARLN